MSKVKKLSWTNVGGCGGPVWRSGRRPDAELDLRYTVNPHWDSAKSDWVGGSIVIARRKVGTATVYVPLIKFELNDDVTMEQARELCQQHFEHSANNYTYTDSEQKIINAYELLQESKSLQQYKEATDLMKSSPMVSHTARYSSTPSSLPPSTPPPPVKSAGDTSTLADSTLRRIDNVTQGRVREILSLIKEQGE